MIRCGGGMGLTSHLLQPHRSCCPPWTPHLTCFLLFLKPGTPATLCFLSHPDNFPIHPVCLTLFKTCVCYLQQRTSTDPWPQSSPLSFCEQSLSSKTCPGVISTDVTYLRRSECGQGPREFYLLELFFHLAT